MRAGLEVINDNGSIVIDENYLNFMLAGSGQVTTVAEATGTGLTVYTASFSVSHENPQLFFLNTGAGFVTVSNILVSGGTTTFYVYADRAATFSYVVFATNIPPAPSNFGLQVYSADGKLVFDANSGMLRYIAVIQSNGAATSSYPVTISPGHLAAVAISACRPSVQQVADTPFPILGRLVDCFQFTGSAINMKRILVGVSPGQPGTTYPPTTVAPPQLLVADITGYLD